MLEKNKLRKLLLQEYNLGHSAAKTTRNIVKSYGNGTVSERTVRRWFKRFRNGNVKLEDEGGRGRLSGVNNEQLKTIIEADPCKSSRKIAIELNVDHTTVVRHLHQIGKVKMENMWVSRSEPNNSEISK